MKWFKHNSDSSIQDGGLTRLLDDQGAAGYGRYFLLMECLARSIDQPEQTPRAEFTLQKWAQVLRLKQKKVKLFLEYLQNISKIKYLDSENGILIELLNPSKILSNRATSSAKRVPSGAPRLDKNIYYQKTIDKETDRKNEMLSNPAIMAAACSSAEARKAFNEIINSKGSNQ